MKVLVTGGAGFIGSFLVKKLLENDTVDKIIVLDNLYSGSLRNLSTVLKSSKLKFIKRDIRDREAFKNLDNVDIVYHLAAIIDVELSLKDPFFVNEVNVYGTLNVLDYMIKNKVDRIIFASSAAVYGEPVRLPLREEDPCSPMSPYGASKLAGENYIKAYAYAFDLNAIIFRIFNVYGPYVYKGQYASVIINFIKRLLSNKPPVIYGDGRQTRDFIYIDDVIEAFIKVINLNCEGVDVYNLGSGGRTSINELADILLKISNLDLTPIYSDPRPGDIKHSYSDISKLMLDMDFRPKVSLKTGLDAVYNYFKWKKF